MITKYLHGSINVRLLRDRHIESIARQPETEVAAIGRKWPMPPPDYHCCLTIYHLTRIIPIRTIRPDRHIS